MELRKFIVTTIREYLNEEVNNDIIVSDYNHSGFIDGLIFKTDGGRLIIGKYSNKRPYGIVDLFVDEEFRRKGIATKLIKYAMNYFEDGFMAQVSNQNSLDLHYKMGFRSFNNNLKPQNYDESKKRLIDNSSIGMASPKLLSNLDKYFK
jgi:GNAT superfamily N-acetyltransferase